MKVTGRVPSKPDARTLRMSQIMTEFPSPPAHYAAATVPSWPVLGNDKEPCCTCAAAAHMIHNWTAANRYPVLVSEQQVLATFAVVSGGDPSGAAMLEVLKFWRRTGIGERKLHAYVALDPHGKTDLQATIYLFGAAYIGLSFPDFAVEEAIQDAMRDKQKGTSGPYKEWRLPAGGATGVNAPKKENGHCVAAIGYDEHRIYFVSCGTLRTMSWEFYRAYNDEAYAVLSEEWYGGDRKAPNGFDLAQLQREITDLRQQATGT